jgi:hypothetical protein
MTTPCFWLDHTGVGEVALRRYHSSKSSPAKWTCEDEWHNSFVFINERVPYTLQPHNDESGNTWWAFPLATDLYAEPVHDDPRWPTECGKGCGYQFTEEDNWQVWISEVMRRADNGEERVLHWSMIPLNIPTVEPGGMWNAEWMRGRGWTNPDKPDDDIFLMVRCPSISGSYGNDWGVDHRASSGGYWTRTGDPRNPPTLSVTPSIQTGDYHGFLGSHGTPPGHLSDHLG